MLHLAPIRQHAVTFGKNHDQVRRRFQKVLVLIRAQVFKRVQPFLRSLARVKRAFFLFGRLAHLAFYLRVAYHHKVPRLQIRSIRCSASSPQTRLNRLARDRPRAELPHRAPPHQLRFKVQRPRLHFFRPILPVGLERLEYRFRHRLLSAFNAPPA